MNQAHTATGSAPATHEGMDAAKREFLSLWHALLGLWGGRLRSLERDEHVLRVYMLHQALADISESFGESPVDAVREEWYRFLDAVPGFATYWNRGWDVHRAR